MGNFKFGNRSEKELATCHSDLKRLAYESLKKSAIDFGISEGTRSIERQGVLYRQGLTKVDGVRTKSKHNYSPSLAFDIYAYVPGKPNLAYDPAYLAYLAGVITTVANELKIQIRWGGNWDSDGEILTDQNFDDMPHFELI